MRLMLRDLWLHLKRTYCILRRKHRETHFVGDLVKKGFRGVPVYQCAFCAEFYLREVDLQRLGGKGV